MFNMVSVKSIDAYVSGSDGWWGVSTQVSATGQVGALLGETAPKDVDCGMGAGSMACREQGMHSFSN